MAAKSSCSGTSRTTDARIEPDKKRKQLVYAYDAATGKLARRTVSGSAVGEIPVGIDVQWDPANNDMDATDMDARDGVLVVAYEKRNALRWYEPEDRQAAGYRRGARPAGRHRGRRRRGLRRRPATGS